MCGTLASLSSHACGIGRWSILFSGNHMILMFVAEDCRQTLLSVFRIDSGKAIASSLGLG
jgi:hypothetical protein